MKTICQLTTGAMLLLSVLASCSKDSKYPHDYIGFEKHSFDYAFDPGRSSEELDVKIITADKKDQDREVTIEGVETRIQHPRKEGGDSCQKEVGQRTHQNLSRTDRQARHPAAGMYSERQRGEKYATDDKAEAQRKEMTEGKKTPRPKRSRQRKNGFLR